MDLIGVQISQMVFPETPRSRKKGGKPENLVKGHLRRWQSPFGFRKEIPLPVEHLHPQASSFRVLIHEVDHLAKSVLFHHRIGVQKKHVLSFRTLDGLVIGFGKAEIFLVSDQRNIGEILSDHFHRAIHGGIVHHDHFPIDPIQSFGHGAQTLLQEILDIVINDDDGELHKRSGGQPEKLPS